MSIESTHDIKKTYCSEYTGDDSIPVFVAFAIEQYGHDKGIGSDAAFDTLSEYGVLEHLIKFYDVLHLHGDRWLMQEIDEFIERKKQVL